MKALSYEKAHTLDQFALALKDVPDPQVRDTDLLVAIHAVGINPGEVFIRGHQSALPGGRLILGWEFAGVVVKAGPATVGFEVGDRVFGMWGPIKPPLDLPGFVRSTSRPRGGLYAQEYRLRVE